jgi:Protein of unknown function (DUF2934)
MRRRHAPKNTAPTNIAKPAAVSHDEVAREAFQMFQARHGAPGDPVADWFEAEKRVKARLGSKPGAKPAPRAAEANAAAGNGRNTTRRGFRGRK